MVKFIISFLKTKLWLCEIFNLLEALQLTIKINAIKGDEKSYALMNTDEDFSLVAKQRKTKQPHKVF